MDNPFDMTIYDKNFNHTGFVVDPIFINMVPSWWNQGYCSFMLEANNPYAKALQRKGARIVVRYRGEHVMSGPIRSYRGDVLSGGTLTYQMLDDYRLLVNTLGYVNPSHVLSATSLTDLGQSWRPDSSASSAAGKVVGQTSYFYWPDGKDSRPKITSAEQAIKLILKQNLVDRLNRPVTIMPDQGRGGDPTAYLPIIRQEMLSEALQPILNNSNMSIRLWQEPYGKTIKIDVVEGGTWGQVLTPESESCRTARTPFELQRSHGR